MVDADVLDAPLPVRRISVDEGVFCTGDDSLGPRSASHRVALRLLGINRRASSIADESVQRAAGGGSADLSAVAASVEASVEAVLSLHPNVIDAESGFDPHAQHRARLRRDLRRWPPADRTTLALRHLVGLEPSTVAAITGRSENDVRAVTSHWSPEDAGSADDHLLRSIDTWIGAGLGAQHDRTARHLAHLDLAAE